MKFIFISPFRAASGSDYYRKKYWKEVIEIMIIGKLNSQFI